MSERFLSIDEMVGTNDVTYKTLDVPEWGGKVRLASSSAQTISEWIADKDQKGIHLLVASLVDGEGNRVGDLKRDVPRFQAKNHAVVDRLIGECLNINGLRLKRSDALRDAKNDSGETATGASPTVSPENSGSSTSTRTSSDASAISV